ncbi:hypothetical protein FB446DRAFT_724323 [Lentinula raphanica]|nr:hypothetical protein FB446DRAFT_724323 [Lentinula raphanica]
MLLSVSPLGLETQRAFTSPSRQLFAVFLVTCFFSIDVIAHPLGSPAPARQPSTTPDLNTLGRMIVPSPARQSAPGIQVDDITLHGHCTKEGDMSIYLTIGATKLCMDPDCPTSESSVLLGYAHFADGAQRDSIVNYARSDLSVKDPRAPWTGVDHVMKLLAITPSGLDDPLSSFITQDTYHSWETGQLNFAKQQTKITQETWDSWASSGIITRKLEMHEYILTERKSKTGKVCLTISDNGGGKDNCSYESSLHLKGMRKKDEDPFKIGYATFADRKARDDFDSFSTSPVRKQKDVLRRSREDLKNRVEELEGVKWRVAGVEKSLDHWAYFYQLMTYLRKQGIVSQETFEEWEREVAKRVKVLEEQKMNKHKENTKNTGSRRPGEGSRSQVDP